MYRTIGVVLIVAVGAMAGRSMAGGAAQDPLAAEIARWQTEAGRDRPGVAIWAQVTPSAQAALAQARAALDAGHRWFALERLAAARNLLSAAGYVGAQPAEMRAGVAVFEAEWTRVGAALGGALTTPDSDALRAVGPAAVRALAETAAQQTKVLYDASLEYGRATDADSGLFYLGSALAQQEFLTFARTLPASGAGRLSPRALAVETAALERRLLSLYQPPVSIDRHPEFISASSALKEARELDAAGLRYGALFKYLQAVQRTAMLERSAARPRADLERDRAGVDAAFAGDPRDHTIVRIFLDRAAVELARTGADDTALKAVTTILDDVVPAYRAALGPAPDAPSTTTPEVTVRLIRWPFT